MNITYTTIIIIITCIIIIFILIILIFILGNFTMIETMKSFELGMDDTFAALEPDVSRDINPDDVISEV